MMLPVNTTLSLWAASLVIDFPDDNIPLFKEGDDWKKWGSFLVQENSFVANASPSPIVYDEWDKWAQAVFNSMSNF